jgi:uncharacterized membrane protein (DUF106 family)
MAEEAAPKPLPSRGSDAESGDDTEEAAEEEELDSEIDAEDARPRPAAPTFRLSTFLYTFLFILGILMLFDTSTRYTVAQGVGYLLGPLIGFGGRYVLLTMFLAAAIEMIVTAVAYNYTTDWVKAAKVQKWSAAFRKVQMAAMRSGKKDRIDALQPHSQQLQRLSTEVTFAQLKGMAITWFLVIAVYSWIYLFLANPSGFPVPIHATCYSTGTSPCSSVLTPVGGGSIDLLHDIIGPIQLWFLVFSLYTVPLSLFFRRVLKHYSLKRELERIQSAPPILPGETPA